MKRLLAFLLFPAVVLSCGTERWAVKTSADKDASRLDFNASVATVSELNVIPAPTRKELDAHPDTRFLAELKTYRVTGVLVGFKRETDEDFHVVIRDMVTKDTMVVEIPAGGCVPPSLQKQVEALQVSFVARFGKPSAKFRNVEKHKMKVEIVGVGFFDFLHGQTGVAKNGFELHRVISWREVQ